MSIFNGIMNTIFDILLLPFGSLPPIVGLIFLSIILGIVFLLLFKYTSPQKTLKKIKNNIKAGLYEVRLYKDDLGIIFKANKSLFANNAKYISCCFIPIAPMLILIFPILVQLDTRYGLAPLDEGSVAIFNVVLSEDVNMDDADVKLVLPNGIKLDAGPVRIPSENTFTYRLIVENKGEYEAKIIVNGAEYTKRIDAGVKMPEISPMRHKGAVDAFMYPAESPFQSDSQIESAGLMHKRAAMLGISGDSYPWMIIFCVVALVAGFAMKGVFKVTI